jgi:hypothetical protein
VRQTLTLIDYHDEDPEPTSNDSPKAIEVERLQEYLSQTLPNIVRQELKRAIDAALAPIEENLTSRLETIVRDCQENATRTFLQNFQPTFDQSSMANPFITEIQYPSGAQPSQEALVGRAPDVLAAYAVPPESTVQSWIEPGPKTFGPAGAPSDSAYYTDMSQPYQPLPSSGSWMTFPDPFNPDNAGSFNRNGMIGEGSDEDPLANESIQRYRGKGKGKSDAMFMNGGPEVYQG